MILQLKLMQCWHSCNYILQPIIILCVIICNSNIVKYQINCKTNNMSLYLFNLCTPPPPPHPPFFFFLFTFPYSKFLWIKIIFYTVQTKFHNLQRFKCSSPIGLSVHICSAYLFVGVSRTTNMFDVGTANHNDFILDLVNWSQMYFDKTAK